MNRKIFANFLILGILLVASCCNKDDYVVREFKDIEMPVRSFSLIQSERNWYQVFSIPDAETEIIQQKVFKDYMGWQPCKEYRAIGVDKIYLLDGKKDDIIVNYKKGYNLDNCIAIYINKTRGHLILFYGVTYGI